MRESLRHGEPPCNRTLPPPAMTEAPKTGSLGIYAKYGAPEGEPTPMDRRAMRFALQSVVREILPKSRTANCLRLRAKVADGSNASVRVMLNRERQTASYHGLQTCSSVWSCPVCAAKIAERRRAELAAAVATHKAQGGECLLLTLTTPHQRGDDLGQLLDAQAKALGRFWKDKSVRKILDSIGLIGQVRAAEVTHGRKSRSNNGWHPHYHVILFAGAEGRCIGSDKAKMQDTRVRLYLRWAHLCEKSGLGVPSFEHGLDLAGGERAAGYVTKWGIEDELVRGHMKKARHGETPFDLLRALLSDRHDKQAAALFREYAEAFKGRRQLHWSHGLKARFAVAEASDQELADRVEEGAELLGRLDAFQWRDVLAVDGRFEVLRLAVAGGWPAVAAFLVQIAGSGTRTGARAGAAAACGGDPGRGTG